MKAPGRPLGQDIYESRDWIVDNWGPRSARNCNGTEDIEAEVPGGKNRIPYRVFSDNLPAGILPELDKTRCRYDRSRL